MRTITEPTTRYLRLMFMTLSPSTPRTSAHLTPRIATLAAVFVMFWVFPVQGAFADCIGPTVQYDQGVFAPGETISIAGIGFGNNCYDTGPPPPGQGALGTPLNGIEVFLEQEGTRVLIAAGSADSEYEWDVSAIVPGGFELGPVDVLVFANGGFQAFDENGGGLEIGEGPDPETEFEVAVFGDEDGAPRPSGPGADTGTNWTPLVALAGAFVAAGAAVAIAARRSHHELG